MKIRELASLATFKLLHGRNLVYNACWEDPRLDRQALSIGSKDNVLVITSAGCNSLDYALDGPNAIYSVDVNPRQNALLELKIAGIRRLDFESFFSVFGRGRAADFRDIYFDALRPELSAASQRFWDRRYNFFTGEQKNRKSFYFRGTSGAFAYAVNLYIDRIAKVRDAVDQILHAPTLDRQQEIYESRIRPDFWNRFVRWALARDVSLAMLGVPKAQRRQIDGRYDGGIVRFIEDSVEAVFARLPLKDNYFWRVYLTGEYSKDCAPEYLQMANFANLKAGLVDRIRTRTSTIQEFLQDFDGTLSRIVLLDHMDWLADRMRPALAAEWQAIVDKAAPDARIIWRSGGPQVDFVDPIVVQSNKKSVRVGELLQYDRTLAEQLHARDRVHTYGSFHIAHFTRA